MAIYIDKSLIGDSKTIPSEVLKYCIRRHSQDRQRFIKLGNYYKGQNPVKINETEGNTKVNVSYGKYIVDTTLGYYLGDPIKYSAEEKEQSITPGSFSARVKNGQVVRDTLDVIPIDISPVQEAYDHQTISDEDSKIGRDIGIYGEAYELVYVTNDKIPKPKSYICHPENCFMVRDDTVEHNKLFFVRYERIDREGALSYYKVYLYTDTEETVYVCDNINDMNFVNVPEYTIPHYFGEVPVIEYHNGDMSMGDYETVTSLIDAYNTLMSDRITDKNKFVDSFLALFSAYMTPEQVEQFKKDKMITLPEGADAKYIQKIFDENSVQVLADALVREIHKQSMTVDMTDQAFAGNSSGQALKLKLLTMTMLVKNKMRAMDKGLKKRFEIYNKFFHISQNMPIIDKCDVSPIFTIAMPINEAEIVDMVVKLQGIVDDETLINQLWFVKDAKTIISKVREQKAESQKAYFDAFGVRAKSEENEVEEDGTETGEED